MDPAELQFHILCQLAIVARMHGFGVRESLHIRFGSHLKLKQVYPTLRIFEKEGWTEVRVDRNSKNGPPRVEHSITRSGRARLAELDSELTIRHGRIQVSRELAKAHMKARDA